MSAHFQEAVLGSPRGHVILAFMLGLMVANGNFDSRGGYVVGVALWLIHIAMTAREMRRKTKAPEVEP